MCGIIGYVGGRTCKPLLVQGLSRLEYRGYDSAGVALREDGGLHSVRAVGPLDNLKLALLTNDSSSRQGIAHTRWATHGSVTLENAHPLTGCDDSQVAIVLNGIVENYRDLRGELIAEGHRFTSETDAEVVAHLVERSYAGDLVAAVQVAAERLEGHFAFVVMHHGHPDVLVGTRRQCPLVIGVGDGEHFVASNAAAFLAETRVVQFPEDGDVVVLTPGGVEFLDSSGVPTARELLELEANDDDGDKTGYETHMLKEIYEQPAAVARTLEGRLRAGRISLDGLGLSDDELRDLRRIVILSAGTSYHAGVVARYAIEEWARVIVEPDIASEWLYRNPLIEPGTLVVGISQSGETRDTISALQLARARGARTLAVTNMVDSQITREADAVLTTRAGLEMSVAASKTFTAQVSLFYLVALKLAQVRGTLPAEQIAALLDEICALPRKMSDFLESDPPIEEVAQAHFAKPFFLYLGRHIGLPVALEGALKLKEISYIPTEAYSAGEMKHGPIALLDEDTPVIVVATDSHVYEKVVSNIQETRARGAQVVAIATDGNEGIQYHADDVVYVPRTHPFLQAVLAVIPLQLLAHRIAELRGLDVDRPRNLAKTVTVE
jgi:glucosamine--fructose-6-phosphate aminotransferase (isomerizing)